MRLEYKSLYLRLITNTDIDQLYEWRNSLDFRSYCSNRQAQVTKEVFVRELKADFGKDRHQQFMIIRKKDNLPVGTIFSYNLNHADGYVFITTFLDEKYRRVGYGALAFSLFSTHLFEEYGLHKIYCEVYSYNTYSLKSLLNGGFIEEGRFREQRFFAGRRYDVIRLAIFRTQALSINERRKNKSKK